MDVSQMQVSVRDSFKSRSMTIQANSKIVKERNWTLILSSLTRSWESEFGRSILRVTSKIEFQFLERDTDGQLHKERVITAADICFSSSTRDVPGVMRTIGKFLSMWCRRVSGRDQGCAESCSDSTSTKVSTDGPDDDSQQGPERIEARLRADRISVAGCKDADLEQTAAQSPGKMMQISSRQLTRLRESGKKVPRQARRQRVAKPGQQRQPHSAERRCTARKKVCMPRNVFIFKEEEKFIGELSKKFLLKLFWNACIWHVLEVLIFYGQWINLHDRSKNGPKFVTNAWIDWYLTAIINVNFNSIVVWVVLQNNAGWDWFQGSDFAGDLEVPKAISGGTLCILEVIHLSQSVGCVRYKFQFRTVQQNQKSFLWMQDWGWMVSPHLIYGIWSSQFITETRIRVLKQMEACVQTNVRYSFSTSHTSKTKEISWNDWWFEQW